MDWGIDFQFLLMNPSLLVALLIILLMCVFQERLFDMSMPRCLATGTVFRYVLCMGYLWVISIWWCALFRIWRGWKSFAKIVPSRLVCQDYWFFGRALRHRQKVWGRFLEGCGWACPLYRVGRGGGKNSTLWDPRAHVYLTRLAPFYQDFLSSISKNFFNPKVGAGSNSVVV